MCVKVLAVYSNVVDIFKGILPFVWSAYFVYGSLEDSGSRFRWHSLVLMQLAMSAECSHLSFALQWRVKYHAILDSRVL
jgi:hypothetical protein